MKKIYALLITTILLMTACQPTPEEAAVVNKNDGVFEQALEATATQSDMQVDLPEESFEVRVPIECPEKWEAHYEKYNGRLKMSIEADVVVGDATKYPVAEIKPYYIPIEQANKIIKAIFGTLDVYSGVYERTKEDMENMIVQVKADIKKAENEGDEESVKQYRETLTMMMETLENAPDEAVLQKYSGEYDIYNGEDSEQWSIFLREDPMNVKTPGLSINNILRSKYNNGYGASVSYGDFSKNQYIFYDDSIIKVKYYEHPIFNTDEAKKAIENANGFLSEVGIEDRVVEHMSALVESEGSTEIKGYKIFYGKKFNSIIIPRNVQSGGSSIRNIMQDPENYIAPFMFEYLTVEVKEGKVSAFDWESPFEIKQIVNDDIELMEFEEIMSKVENQLSVRYAYLKMKKNVEICMSMK